jgi:multicomponent Na+:H+ antiporter subunit E
MKHLGMRVIVFAILLGLWLLLTAPFSVQELILGSAVALLIAVLPLPGLGAYGDISLLPKRLWFAFVYLWVFLIAVVKSNLDVAFRVLHPRLPINPGIVKVKTRLKSPLGRLILANSITLTPGTITVDIHGDELFIHWLSIEDSEGECCDVDDNTEKIVSGFEKYLEVIFG